MSRVLNGSRLVNGDMPGLGRDHGGVMGEHCVDHSGIGLGAAYQQEHIGLWSAGRFAYLLYSGSREAVFAVSGFLNKVGFREAAEYLGMGPLDVIASEGNHISGSCYQSM